MTCLQLVPEQRSQNLEFVICGFFEFHKLLKKMKLLEKFELPDKKG